MYRLLIQKAAVGAIVSAVMLAVAASAEAGWRHHHSSGGSSGSSGSSGSWGSSGSSGSWGSHSRGSWGSFGGLFHRWHHRHHYRAAYHGSSGSSGSSGSWGSHGSSGSWGSSGSSGSSGGSSYYYSPQQVTPPPPPGGDELPPAESAYLRNTDAMLTVNVPQDAKVFVNGSATTSTGAVRQYISRGLDSDRSYTYEVRAEVTRNGQTIEQTKSIRLEGGQSVSLAFDMSSQTPATTLTLNVPEDAKVTLGGKETSATGDVRTYRTTKLESGKSWSGYKILVAVERDGEMMTKEETITLSAGDEVELTFNFDAANTTKVASAR